jgi:2-C-methyl-D-erythritol 4-phosphate cytidylyltransferase
VAAIVPAAGLGRRFGGPISKPLVSIDGAPLVVHALRVLERSRLVRWIIPVVRPEDVRPMASSIARYKISKALAPCVGGESRAESVARGFAALPPNARWVLIHDGARPCLSLELIQRVVRAAFLDGAAACGLPSPLTVKAVDEKRHVRLTLDREHLWLAQTPQVFRRDWFAQALSIANHDLSRFPDDAAIFEAAGFRVRMVPGDPLNLKVTTSEDLMLVEAILARRNSRDTSIFSSRSPREKIEMSRHGKQ